MFVWYVLHTPAQSVMNSFCHVLWLRPELLQMKEKSWKAVMATGRKLHRSREETERRGDNHSEKGFVILIRCTGLHLS